MMDVLPASRGGWLHRLRTPEGIRTLRADERLSLEEVCRRLGVQVDAAVVEREAGDVAVVVTCHNEQSYLGECLDAVMGQTVRPVEVIVVDDASDDPARTEKITQQYGPAVRFLAVGYGDCCKARQAGYEQLHASRYVMFQDGDDIPKPTYLERCREALDADSRLGIAYAPGRYLGGPDDGQVSPYIGPCTYDELRRRNYIPCNALTRRDAFEHASGWRAGGRTRFQDWHLWLRISHAGWRWRCLGVPLWQYRRHAGSMSARARQGQDAHAVDQAARATVMAETFHLLVVTAFCGRAWALGRTLDAYRSLGWEPSRLHLLAVDNSGSAAFGERLRDGLAAACADWASVTVYRDETAARPGRSNRAIADDPARRDPRAVAEAIARIYGRIVPTSIGRGIDLVLTIEDDIEPLGGDVALRLLDGLWWTCQGITGVVRSRFRRGELIVHHVTSESPYKLQVVTDEPGEDVIRIGACGYGLTLWRAEAWRELMPPYATVHDAGRCAWHDHVFCAAIRAGGFDLRLARNVQTRHWSADGTWV